VAVWNRFFGGAASTAAGYGVGSALSPALSPITQAVANEVWAKYPDRPITPEEAAEAVVRGVMKLSDAEAESLANGINEARFATLHALAGEPPGAQQMLELWNRGAVDEADVNLALKQSRLRPEWIEKFKALRTVLVPVSDLVRMAVREVFDPEQRAALDLDADYPAALTPEARKLGLAEKDARNYWAAHWNLPSYDQAAQMLFRGELTQAQFDNLLRALDYAPTWRTKLKTIAQAIPSVSDFIRFAVREVYSPDVRARFGQDDDYPEAFTAKAALHGLAEEDARAYWAAHWELPSTEQGFRMLHRDVITKPELELLLRAKDVMPFWRGKLEQIAYLKPGRVDLRRMLAADVIDRARVKRGYLDLGYTEQDAETLTRFAEELAKPDATTKEDTHAGRAQTQLWGTLHRAYMAGDVTAAQVTAKLPQAGVDAATVPKVLTTWNHEREIQRQRITPAQLKKAWQKAVTNPATTLPWSRDDVLAELLSRGWSSQDANTFLDTPTGK
jgi:hypothetical protein